MAELYSGKARISEVYTENLQQWQIKPKKGAALTEDEVASSFNICFKVTTADEREFNVDAIEVSPRELTGKLLEIYSQRITDRQPRQSDVALNNLYRLKLISAQNIENIAEVFNTVGTEVEIVQEETQSGDKAYVHTRFAFGPKKLSQKEIAEKLAMLQGKKPASAQAEDAPF